MFDDIHAKEGPMMQIDLDDSRHTFRLSWLMCTAGRLHFLARRSNIPFSTIKVVTSAARKMEACAARETKLASKAEDELKRPKP